MKKNYYFLFDLIADISQRDWSSCLFWILIIRAIANIILKCFCLDLVHFLCTFDSVIDRRVRWHISHRNVEHAGGSSFPGAFLVGPSWCWARVAQWSWKFNIYPRKQSGAAQGLGLLILDSRGPLTRADTVGLRANTSLVLAHTETLCSSCSNGL